jgi:hypothetical protein
VPGLPVLDRKSSLCATTSGRLCRETRFAAPSQMALKRGSGVTV